MSLQTLRERVLNRGPLSPTDAVELGIGLLSTLASAHEEGALHGGLDPDAVLVTKDDAPRFVSVQGFGRSLSDRDYTAPEVANGKPPNVRADLYACAAVLFFACTGVSPKERSITPMPPSLSELVLRGLQKRRGRREGSAREMLETLQHALCS
jgi:serine/threonine protein kinase